MNLKAYFYLTDRSLVIKIFFDFDLKLKSARPCWLFHMSNALLGLNFFSPLQQWKPVFEINLVV